MAKVTDPALLAELEGTPAGKVVDPALLAELEGRPAAAVPSMAAALGRGAAQGATLGFGDEIQGFIQAMLPPPGGDSRGYFGGMAQRYRSERDAARAENERAKAAHGTAYTIGNVAGGIAPAVLLPASRAAQGASLGTKVAAGARAAAPIGAAYGAGESTADDLGGVLKDAAAGAAGGAVVGAAAPVAGRVLTKTLGAASDALGDRAVRFGRNAIAGVTNSLARRKPLDPAAVDQAFRVGAIRPGSTVEGIANRLQDAADPLAQRYGQILQALEAKGVTGPNAQQLAAKLATEAQAAADNSIIGTRSGALQDAASALTGSPGGHMRPAVPAKPTDAAGNLGLMQTELMKRELQAAAANDFVKEGTQSLAGAARKELAGAFREEIEQAVRAQAAKAPDEAAEFEPVKHQLHLTLQALGSAREGAGRYARRTPFGLHEAMGLASGIATGNPLEAAGAAGVMHALKDRGASTAAWFSRRGSEDLGRLAGLQTPRAPTAAAAALSPEMEALIAALRARAPSMQPHPGAADEERP